MYWGQQNKRAYNCVHLAKPKLKDVRYASREDLYKSKRKQMSSTILILFRNMPSLTTRTATRLKSFASQDHYQNDDTKGKYMLNVRQT